MSTSPITLKHFIHLLDKARRQFHLAGNEQFGVLAALDMEGRLFTILNGEVASRVNEEAISNISTKDKYWNPGGDTLWPAPEGTCFGYQYPTGKWRVPPGLTGARYIVTSSNENCFVIEAEIDLVNSQGLGLPCIFRRAVKLDNSNNAFAVKVEESIKYIGYRTLTRNEFLLAPWSLSQFDSAPGAEVLFPEVKGSIRDLYDPSEGQRSSTDGLCHTKTDSSQRYQIALSESVDWIEFRNPSRKLTVRRTASKPASGLEYIDIADAPPDTKPDKTGARFSVYSDTNGFMEIEAVGTCPKTLTAETESNIEITTVFKIET